MTETTGSVGGNLIHIVTLECKDSESASRCIDALENHGKADAMSFDCVTYEFGMKEGTTDTVCLVERWNRWDDLDALLGEKVIPALPLYNQLLKRPFDPGKDTVRVSVSSIGS